MHPLLQKTLRHTFNAALAASLLLLAATVFMWIRSYIVYDVGFIALPQFGNPLSNPSFVWATGRGGIRLEFDRRETWINGTTQPQPRAITWAHETRSPTFYPTQLNPHGPNITGFSSHGFELLTYRDTFPHGNGEGVVFERYLLAPLWALLFPWLILPALYWFWVRPRRHAAGRRARGECPGCGYDLRAHPPGARCPECGTAVPAPS